MFIVTYIAVESDVCSGSFRVTVSSILFGRRLPQYLSLNALPSTARSRPLSSSSQISQTSFRFVRGAQLTMPKGKNGGPLADAGFQRTSLAKKTTMRHIFMRESPTRVNISIGFGLCSAQQMAVAARWLEITPYTPKYVDTNSTNSRSAT